MLNYLIDSLLFVADIFYLVCVSVFDMAFTPISHILQPDIYSLSYVYTAPFRGTVWDLTPATSSDVGLNWFGDGLASLLNLLGVSPSMTVFEGVFYIVIAFFAVFLLFSLIKKIVGK